MFCKMRTKEVDERKRLKGPRRWWLGRLETEKLDSLVAVLPGRVW